MLTPLLVIDRSGEVSVFASAPAAAAWMEAQDVRDGEYRLLDSAGSEFLLTAETDNSPVQIGPEIGQPDFEAVRLIVEGMVAGMPSGGSGPEARPNLNSPDLIRQALAHFT